MKLSFAKTPHILSIVAAAALLAACNKPADNAAPAETASAPASTAAATGPVPAIIFDMGGKFDKSFNEAAYNGMEQFKKETGIQYKEFEIANEAQREQAIRRMAEEGASPIIGVGFGQASSIEKIAQGSGNRRSRLSEHGIQGCNRLRQCLAITGLALLRQQLTLQQIVKITCETFNGK